MPPKKKSKNTTSRADRLANNSRTMSRSSSFWPRIEAARILGMDNREDMFDAIDQIIIESQREATRYMMNYFIEKCGGLSKYKHWRKKQDDRAKGIYT